MIISHTPDPQELERQVLEALRPVKDPDLGISVLDLGLIYKVWPDLARHTVTIDMTLTTPACPSGPEIIDKVKKAALTIRWVKDAYINLVWTPPWTEARMNPRLRTFF